MPKRMELPASHWIDNIDPGYVEGIPNYLKEYLLDALDELPTHQRDVVEMRLWGQMTFRQIARKLGYKSHSSVYNKYNDAMDYLRERLDFEDFARGLRRSED